MKKITLSDDVVERINKLKKELRKDFDRDYSVEDVIEKALQAFEDVRSG